MTWYRDWEEQMIAENSLAGEIEQLKKNLYGEIATLRTQIADQGTQIADQDTKIANQDTQIADLKSTVAVVQSYRDSEYFRTMYSPCISS